MSTWGSSSNAWSAGAAAAAPRQARCAHRSQPPDTSGVAIIEIATTALIRRANGASTTPLAATMPISTKANSPPPASAAATLPASRFGRPASRPAANMVPPLIASSASTAAATIGAWRSTRRRSRPAPTVMKNRPSSSPRNGSISASSSRRNSLSASITPARKAPSAGDSPTSSMSEATATTSSSAVAVKISRRPAEAMKRKAGARQVAAATDHHRDGAEDGEPALDGRQFRERAPAGLCHRVAGRGEERQGGEERDDRQVLEQQHAEAREPPPPRAGARARRAWRARSRSTTSPARCRPPRPAASRGRPPRRPARSPHPPPTSWAAPSPKIEPRSCQSSAGRTSSPIRNSRITTPNSAKSTTAAASPASPSTSGPISTPASR